MAVDKRKADNFYQTTNFYFRVQFNAPAGGGKASATIKKLPSNAFDIRFQSVSGLDSTLDTESFKEGGENRFEHVVPVRRKYGPLTLKRGLLTPGESTLTAWLKQAIGACRSIVTLDNHYLHGGQGQMIAAAVAALSLSPAPRVAAFGVAELPECGTNDEVLQYHGLDIESLTRRLRQAVPQVA